MVFQNFTLIPALSVFENVALFQKNLPAVVPRAEILERMRHYAERFRLVVDPFMPARQLAVGDTRPVHRGGRARSVVRAVAGFARPDLAP